jgi:hypothetical protein
MSEIYADIEKEALISGTDEVIIVNIGYTEVETSLSIYHLIFSTTADANTAV